MIPQALGWIAGKLFFGGNRGAVNLLPAVVIAAALALGSGWLSSKITGWSNDKAIAQAEKRAAALQLQLDEQRIAFESAQRQAQQQHLAALIERDAQHQRDLERQADVVAEARTAAKAATTRFARLNARLKDLDRENPRVACPADPGRLRLLDDIEAAANGLPAAGGPDAEAAGPDR